MIVPDTAPLDATGPRAATTVHLSGRIDIFTSKALRQRLLNAMRDSTSTLIVDVSQVSFCDSSGLGVLVGVQHRARERGITLALTGPRPHLTRLLHASGLDRSLPVVV
ncbi:STAS domain-containing protein [Sphaerisporangium sp. TRM90804]|uniref:STAS domain-containing protein n=1 Tax=Sphaerisporangium sp. TRM90804 TaxID=3031113 RepID=UPI002446C182|nr:STAS domain-containing protein [Sphaerisporangium sp. TRM90804]MDH2426186.1 STAS domain-containing protein [Sphaerisporangium sp. TRM90804]